LRRSPRSVAHVDQLNLQPNVRPFTPAEYVPYLLGWQALADDAGVTTYVETRRDRMTNDLFFTLELLDAVPALKADRGSVVFCGRPRVCLDRLMRPTTRSFAGSCGAAAPITGVSPRASRSRSRPASLHHRQWLDLFAGWQEGFRQFRVSAPDDAVLTFTTELGPPYW
jgi:hypothetical protein